MDFKHLESNQSIQTRDRPRRCHSRLADALVYSASSPEQKESPERLTELSCQLLVSSERLQQRAKSVDISTRNEPEQQSTTESLSKIVVSNHPSVTASYIETSSSDNKKGVTRTYSETAKVHIPAAYRKDNLSELRSVLASPETSFFSLAYRTKDSPSPLTASPLPPGKGSLHDQEVKLLQHQVDNIKNKKGFDYFEIGLETSDAGDKEKYQSKVQQEERNDEQIEPVDRAVDRLIPTSVQQKASKIYSTDSKITDVIGTLTNDRGTNDIPRMSKSNINIHPPMYSKTPNGSKGQIIVRGTKASRLRQINLQIKNEQSYVTQDVLPAVAASDKTLERPPLAKSNPQKHRTKKNLVQLPAYRETKATKLRRLKRIQEEGEAKGQNEEKMKDMIFDQSLVELLQKKRTTTPTFKPAPPKPYKKPEPVFIKETRASKLRKVQENLKKTGNTVAVKEIMSQGRPQKHFPPTNVKETLASRSRQVRSPTPTFKPTPPKPYKKPGQVVVKETRASKLRKMPENMKKNDKGKPVKRMKMLDGPNQTSTKHINMKQHQEKASVGVIGTQHDIVSSEIPIPSQRLPPISQNETCSATPVILKELRESAMYQEQYVNKDLVATPRVKWSGSRALLWLVDNPDCSSDQIPDDVSEIPNKSTDSSSPQTKICDSEFDDDVSESSDTSSTDNDVSNGESDDDVSESSNQSMGTSSSVWDGEFDPEAMKYFRSLTPVQIEWKPQSKKRMVSPILKVSDAISSYCRKVSPLITSTPVQREFLDRSARDRLCRMELARGFKCRKEIRLAMEEEGRQWESEIMTDVKIPEETYRVQRSVEYNKEMVQKELDGLRERLRQAEVVQNDQLKSKEKSFFSRKFKTYFQGRKAGTSEKERKETTDDQFKRTEEKLSRQLSHDWVTFLLQQNCHHEMLKKARLQEELIYQWKSQAIHYKILHTMLGKDLMEGKKRSWYI